MKQQFKVRVISFLSILSLLFGALGLPTQNALAADAGMALQFNGSNQYVTFGSAAGMDTGVGVQVFTIETWFKKTGAGVTTSTGTGGITALPLVTKGRGQAENSNQDMNYFFGIDSTGVLSADFEECAISMTGCPATATNTDTDGGGQNYPAKGSTVIQNNIWYHAAVTFDGRYWKFYLNGVQDGSTTDTGADRYPRWDSIQHAGIATAMQSTGAAAGYFAGIVDEVRIWNVVRTQPEIQADMYNELTSGTGLIGRWGLNDGSGTTTTNSIAGRPNGTLSCSGSGCTLASWVTGFPIPDSEPPAAPTGLTATAGGGSVSLNWTANTEPDIAGYNLYRSTTTGGPYTKINTTLITPLNYSDGGLTNGTPYYYVLRAVDSSSNESGDSSEVTATPVEVATGLQFNGTNQYVTFGAAPGLGVTNFTLETWFYWTGGGTTASTGAGGIVAIPLVTKGLHEVDGSNKDANFFLGIQGGKLAADFEDMATGLNHPVVANTTITTNTWHHAAVTYDSVSSVWTLYLDGIADGTLDIGSNVFPRSDSIQHAGLAVAMDSLTPTTYEGRFAGTMDEVRIWNVARTEAEIMAAINSELTSGAGLVARWGLNEGAGASIASSVGTFPGALTNGPTWVAGAPFNIAPPSPPAAPTLLAATPTAGLQIDLSWTDNSTNETSFKVERSPDGSTGWAQVGTTAANITTFSNGGLDPATQYCYRVRASNSAGDSDYSNVSCATTPGEPNNGLDFGSSSAYASIPTSSSLNTSTFTIETWLRRDGTGAPVTTGTGGVTTAIPLIAKGTSEAEDPDADINYFLAVENATGKLCADFEEAPGGANPSQNHPVCGTTTLVNGTWYHAAAAYDGTTWKLYLNGNLEATLTVGQPANAVNTALFAMGTSITTTGTAQGFFDGALDEVRVWNYPRSQTEIQGTMNSPITSPQSGLLARWGLNETTGTAVPSSAGTSVNGTITGTGYSWGAGAPAVINHAPEVALESPGNGATNVSTSPALIATVTDPDVDDQTVSFYGRLKNPAPGADFTIIPMPDTQHYTDNGGSNAANFSAQTQWIVDNKDSRNIVFVTGLGDIVENGDTNDSEWQIADGAYSLIEDPLTTLLADGIPYGLSVGNHDQSPIGGGSSATTSKYNEYFGIARFNGRGYYGGHFGSDNDNNYELFSASGLDFIIIHFEYDTTPEGVVLDWADNLLTTYSNRRAILSTHYMINTGNPGSWGAQGQALYNALSDHPNLFLMLGGHVPGEGRRQDTAVNGNVVNTLLSDYQSRANGGDGWLRIMTFSPANNSISVETYSPVLDQYETDADSQFTLSYSMAGAPAAYQLIGTDNAASGGTASVTWNGLANGTEYEWYAETSDGTQSATSATFSFTTQAGANQAPVITEGTSADVTMSEDGAPTAFNLTLHATDADAGDTLTWSVSTPASNGTASATGTGLTKDISYTPTANYNGSDSFVVQVSDGNGGTDTITVNVTVEAVNDPPQVTNPGAQTSTEGDTASLQIQASDVDLPAQTLTYSATSLPGGLSINSATGLVDGNIALGAAANSPYNVTVTVTDGITPVQQSFTWNVSEAPIGLCGNDPTLVGCWPMEEGSGSVLIDASSFGNDGNITGSPTWVPGQVGQALDLSGTGQYAMVPDSNSLDITSNRITLAAWIKPEKVATQNIIKKTTGTTVANGYEVSLSAAGKVFMRLNGNSVYRIDSLASYPTSGTTWMHVAATYDGTDLRIYINGVLDNTKAATLTIAPNTTNLGIGAEPTFINLFQGLLDDVRVYNRALSLGEIEVLAGITPVSHTLSVTKAGTGSGTVTSNPAGIDCGATCSYDFAETTLVTLTASPDSGSTFTGWSGACTGTGSCQVTMDAAKSVNAGFAITPPAFGLSCTTLQPKPLTAGTGEKPQSKVWYHAGAWWSVFPTNASGASSAGTWLWKLEGTAWTEVLKLSDRTDVKADAKAAGSVAHILLYAGTNTELVSVEYSGGSYQLWTNRPAPSPLSLSGSEIATIDIDSAGRMWLATENDATGQIIVYYSDSPYSTWSAPITLASGVNNDDISVVVKLPNQIGVLWSNQNTRLFGFRVHNDADAADVWADDEVPASQSALDVGLGMADDHLNVKVASDGTLYAAVKTSYDTATYPKVALLVRQPAGTWDNLYSLGDSGTRGNIELDEVNGVLTYIYTQSEGYNPIVYKQSDLSPISFGSQMTLRAEGFNDVSSTKQNYNNELVVIYSSSTQVAGQICTGAAVTGADLAITKDDGQATVQPSEAITYTITATNNGPDAVTNATVVDTMPAALTGVSWACTASGGASCAASGTGDINDTVDLPVGDSLTYSVSGTVDPGASGDLSNTATVSAPAGITDPLPGNNTATDTDAIITGGATCENDSSLVGCWQMEEGSGSTLIDGSSFSHDATAVGGPTWAAGRVGTYALDLNGTSQYAYVPDDAPLDITNQITLAAWIKPEVLGTNPQDLIKKAINGTGAAGTDGYELGLSSTTSTWPQKVFFRINQATSLDTYRVNSTTLYPIDGNTWMHVAATFDGTDLKLYINGQLEGTVSAAGQTIAANSLPLSLGAQDGATPSRYYMGWMDEARVYNRALSLSEIQQLAGVTTTYTLTVNKTGTGDGTVTSVPAGIDCGATCSYSFAENTLVTLTAAPAAGSTFTGWSGAGCSGTGTCQITMDAVKTVAASFELEAACFTVTTNVTPSGSGTINNATAQNCAGGYIDGTTVELTAVPNAFYVFSHWSGDATGSVNPLSVTMDGNKSITAEFVLGAGAALDFGSTNAYVDFGNPTKLHLPQFTVETWFRRDGPGDTTLTGTDGSNATALVARGRGEIEDPNVDLNYFLGIDVASNKLVADFEEGATGTNPSQNHPVYGATTITTGVWHHVAATYDGTTWKLYLDGVLDGELTVGEPPAAAGNQRASIGAGLYSTGEPDGFFDGVIDEARIWDRPLSASEIRANINQEVSTGSGLVARWGLDEGTGIAIHDSLPNPADGTILGTNYVWATGAPFNILISPTISGNAGVAGATLGYTDGTPKTATADGAGLYSFEVSYNWSGTVTPSKTGYTFTPASKTYSNVTSDKTGEDYVATQDTFTLSYAAGAGGTLSGETSQAVAYGGNGTPVTAVPDTGYHFVDWSDGLTDNPRTDINVTANVSVTANFAADTFTLEYAAGTGGTLTGETSQVVAYGGNGTAVTAVPDIGYHFVDWSDGSTDNPRTDINITANVSVTANFLQNEYTLTATTVGNGTVTAHPAQATYHYGDVVQVTAEPVLGWTFDHWSGDATGSTNPVSVTMDANKAIIATFTQNEYTLTVNSAHGMVTKSPDQATYHYGDEVTLSVTADPGWTFTGWTPSLTDNKVTITGDTTLTANYSQNEYTLTVISAHGTVTKSPDQATYHLGDVVTLEATPEAGWNFIGWSGDATGTANPIDVTITGNMSVTANYSQNEYTLMVVSAHGAVSKSPDQATYHLGDVVTLTATPDAGWNFASWSGDATSTANPIDVTITGNMTVTANYSQNEYTLIIFTNGSGQVSKDPAQATYHYGDVVQLSATADPGWTFSGWSGDLSGSNNPESITITGNATITAAFTQDEYSLTVSTVGNGTVTTSPDQATYLSGTIVELTAAPAPGWSFAGWSGDLSGSNNPESITMDGDKTITATFAQNTYTLDVAVVGGGTVTKNPELVSYPSGTSVELTAIPASGWSFAGWSGDANGSTNPLTVTMDGDKSITATFTQNEYTLTIVSDRGAVTKSPDQGSYHYGDIVQLTATPNAGWSFTNWSGDATGSANPVSVTINGDTTVTANYTQIVYTLTVNITGSGTVTNDPDQATYHYGDVVRLTAIPSSGWSFSDWNGDVTGATNPVDVTIDDNKTVMATFVLIPPTCYTLTISHSGLGTDPAASPANSTGCPTGQYTAGENISLSGATPAAGWQISGWTGTDDNANTASTNTLTMPASAHSASVIYTQIEYILTIVSEHGTVTKDPAQATYHYGDVVQLTAIADPGWNFAGWSGDLNGSNNPEFITINGDKSVTANFAQITYDLTIAVDGNGTTNPLAGVHTYAESTVVDITATPAAGYAFSHWSGACNGTDACQVTMDADKTVTAHFTAITHVLTIAADPAGGGTTNPVVGAHTYAEGTVVDISATPNSGFAFDQWSGACTGTGACQVTMDGDKTVTASFIASTEVTVTFQNGVAGYTGAVDTHIMEAEPTTNHGALQSVEWDADDPAGTGQDKYALILFDDIFGSGLGQIPPGATIQSATLRYEVFNIGNPADVNEVIVDWTGSETWSSFGGDSGVQPDEHGASLGTANGDSMSLKSLDVTSSLVTWLNNPSINKGWIFRPTGSDGVDFYSSEYTTVASRPSLEVTYLPGGPVEQYTLTVNPIGNGSVTLNPPGGTYSAGTLVQLTAEPAAGYAFDGWSGDLSGSANPESITMHGNKTVTATFIPIPPTCYTLTLSHSGQGSNPSASPANSMGCAAGKYVAGENIALSGATPDAGWQISGWTGTDNDASTASSNSVTMPASDHSAGTIYTQSSYTLIVNAIGSGTVTKNPDLSIYPSGTSVELTATPASGWTFTGWSGDATGSANPISIVMDGNKSVTASFTSGASGIFSDGFESGNLSAWSSSTTDGGDLRVSVVAALVGGQGLQAVIDDNKSIFVTDDSPNAETNYLASFYFDPNSIPMASGDAHFIFNGFTGASTAVLRLEFRKFSGAYQIRVRVANDGSGWVNGNWITISDAVHLIELEWHAATGVGANNGSLKLSVDGAQQANLTGVDNDTRRIDRARLGAVTGVDTGTRGAYYFDEYVSLRSGGGPQPTATLTVSKTGSGGGTVTSNPAGINCGSTCSSVFNTNTVVTLTASAASGSTFTGWSGGGCSGTGACNVTLTADASVTANFNLQSSSHTLTVNKSGSGSGTVTSNPAGIDCGLDCSEAYASNTSVTLIATAASGSTFTGWSGGGCSGIGTCNVTMTASTSVTANFDLTSPADVIFANGFELGNLSAWTSSNIDAGDLSVTAAAKLVGNYGMQALIDDNNSIFVTDDSPNAEARYRARFYFDPNSIVMASSDAHIIFSGLAGSSTAVLRLEFRQFSGAYQVRVRVLSDGSAWTNTNWFTISDTSHSIEFDWRAATAAGANNGGLTLWIDGIQQADLTGVDNDTQRMDRVRLGAVTGVDTGTRGTYYFDAFESRRLNYIGP